MKDFKNTTKMVSGHRFAHGGHVSHHPHRLPVSAKPANRGEITGLDNREPDMYGNAGVKREEPSTQELAELGGKSELTGGYKKGGKTTHFHVHKHYHSGGGVKSVSKSYQRSAERQAEREVEGHHPEMSRGGVRKARGGLIKSGTAGVKLGKNPSSNGTGTPSMRSHFKRGGKIGPVKKGALHKEMGIPQGEKIGKKRLEAAKHSSSPTERKRANFALNMNKATGGTINPRATGGTINRYATGGTRDRMNCGGAMYAEGGEVKMEHIANEAVRRHVRYPAPTGHKGLGKMVRSKA